MATSKKTRKRKPSRQSAGTYNRRYLVSTPRGSGHADDDVVETWFLNVDHAIEHCLNFGPQFSLDTAESPPTTLIIDTVRTDGSGVNFRKVPLDVFMSVVESGQMTVHHGPWCTECGNWHD